MTATADLTPSLVFGRLALLTLGVAVVVGLLGYLPTRHVAGAAGVPSLFAGLAIAVVAGLLGVIPAARAVTRDHAARHGAILAGMTIRLAATILITAAVALSGAVAWRPLVLWVAIGYVVLLGADTFGLASVYRRLERKN
jgi:uncharacterized membrane protein